MIVDEHPVLLVDSTSLPHNILFGANFLNKCSITLDYENSLVQWMEYTIPLHDTLEFFPYSYYTLLFMPLELESEHNLFGNTFADTYATCILDAK